MTNFLITETMHPQEWEVLSDWFNGNRKDAVEKYLLLSEMKKIRLVGSMAPEEQGNLCHLVMMKTGR